MNQHYDLFIVKLKAMQTQLKPTALILEKYEEWKPDVIDNLNVELVFAIIKGDTTGQKEAKRKIKSINNLRKDIETGLLE